MKHSWLAGLALLVGGIGAAEARTDLSIAVGVPLGGVYYDSYYAPPPPPVYRERVYYEPRPVYYQPRPVYYGPRRVDVRYYHDHSDHRYCDHDRRYYRARDRWDDDRHYHGRR
jgi:hypothetical protein